MLVDNPSFSYSRCISFYLFAPFFASSDEIFTIKGHNAFSNMFYVACCEAKLLLHFEHSQLNNKRSAQNYIWFSTSQISIEFLKKIKLYVDHV